MVTIQNKALKIRCSSLSSESDSDSDDPFGLLGPSKKGRKTKVKDIYKLLTPRRSDEVQAVLVADL